MIRKPSVSVRVPVTRGTAVRLTKSGAGLSFRVARGVTINLSNLIKWGASSSRRRR